MSVKNEQTLKTCRSIPALVMTLQESLRNGHLGRHLPRVFAPNHSVAEAPDGLAQEIKLVGVRGGMALVEIAATTESVHAVAHSRAEELKRYDSLGNLRWRAGYEHIYAPWFRALIPLKGSIDGTTIQIKQPTTFPPARVGFVQHGASGRRGVPSRHFYAINAYGGSVSAAVPLIRVCRPNAIGPASEIDICLPFDYFTSLKLVPTATATVVVVTDGALLVAERVDADREARKTLRASAMDAAARIGAAVALIDCSGLAEKTANTLQDMLGMTLHNSDYAFGLEVESASGRPLIGDDFAAKAKAAVILGAVCAGVRSPFSHENEAQAFVETLVNFSKHLQQYEDNLFTVPTRFSCKLSPEGTQYDALEEVIPNTQLT